MRYEELAALSTPTAADASPRDVFARRQRLLRVLLEKSEALRSGEIDEDFYETLRERLRAVGATRPDIEAFAKVLVVGAVECTVAGSPEREVQFERIAPERATRRARRTSSRSGC
jgi:hypothetical protein